MTLIQCISNVLGEIEEQMGLGPPVCKECNVIGDLTEKKDPRYGTKVRYGYSFWHCPNCGTAEMNGHLWEYTKRDQDVIEFRTDYLKHLQKIKGKDFRFSS